MLRLDHWSESLRGLNNPRGRGENDAISDRGVAEVTNCIISHPDHEGFQTEERLVRKSLLHHFSSQPRGFSNRGETRSVV